MSCAPERRVPNGPDPPAATSIVVVGASAGGVEALIVLAGSLPADLPAVVLVVLHVAPAGTSLLHHILDRFCALPVTLAADDEILRDGTVVVAPADRHLLVHGDAILLDRGAKEHRHRPAVDPAMRSAALARGPAAVGIVLSGTRADGTAGLAAIKARGGLALAQDPSEALHGGMPRSAIDGVRLDAVLPVAEMAAWLGGRLRPLPARPGACSAA
ncbi:MAG: two-component system, chemotaxis family, protein-glutamate methylesterase/glutaminase [Solirubrobacteraceae bacterium]|nr:two-component system, chemotaxis family, protein-glutamate methylesterase/glutaminase [Solirubrobacteraceae bacterium]